MLTVGELLQTERIKKNLSLKDVEKKIRVREKFLKAIEQNNWEIFASKVYISGIIKNYSSVLSLDADKMLAFFRREYARKEDVSFKKRITNRQLTPQTRRYFIFGMSLVILAFCFYFGFQVYRFFTPPKVEILIPRETTVKRKEKIHIVGRTEKEAVITIFGDRIYQNKSGYFTYDLPLKEGRNEIVIEVVGANGKKSTVRKEFFLNP